MTPVDDLETALDAVQEATDLTRRSAQTHLLTFAEAQLLEGADGVVRLLELAPRFEEAGVFVGGPWEDPRRLQVALVGGTLRAPGLTPVAETLSELRMLAVAQGRATSAELTADEAVDFLQEVVARNLGYLLPSQGATEAERSEGPNRLRQAHERLFALIVDELDDAAVLDEMLAELDQRLAQRPISTWAIKRTIHRISTWVGQRSLTGPAVDRVERYARAYRGPTPLSAPGADGRAPGPRAYRDALAGADRLTQEQEARGFAASMLETGLVAPAHGVFVRWAAEHAPALLAPALGLDAAGEVELDRHLDFVRELIAASVFATTAQCLYGLREALSRTLLSRPEVTAGLERLVGLEILPEVAEALLARRADDDDVSADAVLLAGTLALLGQPLGLGQGFNPSCQSARALSLWAQHDPATLVERVVAAARDGWIDQRYAGQWLRSDQLPPGMTKELDLDLDPVSIVLVPHLDRLYSEMMRRSGLYLEDAHKWINPAMYGRWVPSELASPFADLAQTTLQGFDTFVRRFFASHHPDFNGGHRLMYPNPVGLVITNARGRYLGPHAVSITRVDAHEGEQRVYFFNPNNEGRQDWGEGITPTVAGHGEEPGESSLPFDQFAARVYAFHYSAGEMGELPDVPEERVQPVVAAARRTWGERFIWLDAA